MAISNFGINIIRNAVAIKGSGVLRSMPNAFHGINPSIKYTDNGKIFCLPRFCSVEMKEARVMNRIAQAQAKSGAVVRAYPKATAEDLEKLCDRRLSTIWTNPKDGKEYCLVKTGEVANGDILVRILDEEGAFVKEAQLTPKNIMIYDSTVENEHLGDHYYKPFSHGKLVRSFVERYNPFAKVELVNIDHASKVAHGPQFHKALNLADEFLNLSESILKGKKVDYISLSNGLNPNAISHDAVLSNSGKTMEEFKCSDMHFPTAHFLALHPNVRILQASGNGGAECILPDLMAKGVEGVGALDLSGRVAEFSASRDSLLTQHYERGVFQAIIKDGGISFFEGNGIDIPIKQEYLERLKNYISLKLKLISPETEKKLQELRKLAIECYLDDEKKMRAKIISAEKKKESTKVSSRLNKEEDTPVIAKLFELFEDISAQDKKLKEAMCGYENEAGLEYKKIVNQLEKEGVVQSTGNVNEYQTINHSPYPFGNDCLRFICDNEGRLRLAPVSPLVGTSFSTPIRVAKLALNDMMEGIL